MPTVTFTPNLARHVNCPTGTVEAATVREALEHVFALNETVRGYVLDDQGALRRHMSVFIDQRHVKDRVGLSDPVRADSRIYVAQALSGG